MSCTRLATLFLSFIIGIMTVFAQTSGDNMYNEGLRLQKTRTISAQNEAISKFTLAKKLYDSADNKKKCDRAISKSRGIISSIKNEGAGETGSYDSSAVRSNNGGNQLSYGTWNGGWKNGKIHGMGTLTFTTEKIIDSRDPNERVAQPGDYVVGEWSDGHLIMGKWHKGDGSKESIIIGKSE